MPNFDLFLPPQTYSRWHPLRRTTNHRFTNAIGFIATWMERVRQREALASLDDRMLRDLGITRTEAVRECEKPFWK